MKRENRDRRSEKCRRPGASGKEAGDSGRSLPLRLVLAGLESVTPHVLRHPFAKALIDSGVTLEKVATLLGHSNLNKTRIYTTPGERALEEAVKSLEEFQ